MRPLSIPPLRSTLLQLRRTRSRLPRLRALALFGRRSVEPAEPPCCRRPKTSTFHVILAIPACPVHPKCGGSAKPFRTRDWRNFSRLGVICCQPRQVSSFNFSTADLPADERRNAVCELRERGIIPIEPLPDSAISVQITKCFLPGAGLLSGTLCGVRQEGTRRAVGASDEVFFGVNLAGQSTAFQRVSGDMQN